MNYWLRLVALLCLGWSSSWFVPWVIAMEPLTAQQVAALSHDDRAALMKAFLERRIDKVRNIDVSSETRMLNRKYSHGRLGDRISDTAWYEFQTLICDGSYRVNVRRFPKPEAKVPTSSGMSHHDEKTGITRTVGQDVSSKQHVGRIDMEHLRLLRSNRVPFHLLGLNYTIPRACDKCDFLLPSLTSCSDQWHIDVDVQHERIVISHPYRIAFVDFGTGERKVYFDVSRGMLPVKIDVDYRGEIPGTSEQMWREERIVMDEAKDFSDLWMPMRITEVIRASPLPADVCSVQVTTIKKIRFGTVRPADLEIAFPNNTQVVDTVKNVFYKTGPHGEPKAAINPLEMPKGPITLDANGQVIMPSKDGWMLEVGLWSLAIGGALLVCYLVLRWRVVLRVE